MNTAVIAALDFPRQQMRAVIVGALIIMAVATAWQVLAQTHIAVVIQVSAFAIYILATARTLRNSWEYEDIVGRGLVAIGTLGLVCAALLYLHRPVSTDLMGGLGQSADFPFVAGAIVATAMVVLGLWLTRPRLAVDDAAGRGAIARALPKFIAFHDEILAPPLAGVEEIRRKTEHDYWKLSALGIPAAALSGLVLIMIGLAGRPPGMLFLIVTLALLLASIGAALLRWFPSPLRREEILHGLGEHLDLRYHFGGGDDPDHRTATIFGSASQAHLLSLLPRYRELKLGAAYRGTGAGLPYVFGEVTTIPPRKLGQNTARLGRHFLLLVVDLTKHTPNSSAQVSDGRTICFEERGLFGHRGMNPDVAGDDSDADGGFVPGAMPHASSLAWTANLLSRLLSGPNAGNRAGAMLDLGHDAFEGRFKVFTDDTDDAHAQLSPRFTDAIMAACQSLSPRETPRFAFDEGQFLLAIEAPRLWFDLDLPRNMALDDPAYTAAIIARLQLILSIVDGLTPDR